MEIERKEENGVSILSIAGRMDAYTTPQAEQAVQEILADGNTRLLMDLSALDYLSSAGLRVILGAVKQLKQSGGNLVVCGMNPFVKEIFDVSGFSSIIPIVDTVGEGVQKLI